MPGCVALVVGAGRGRRFGGDIPKQYLGLCGEPVLRRTLRAFADHPAIDHICVVFNPDDRDLYDPAVAGLNKMLAPVPGGASRQESVRNGLESLEPLSPDLVLIHDAARPFVSADLIDDVIATLADAPGALPAVAVADTLKRTQDGRVAATVPRDHLWRAQTPQGFRFAPILAAHRAVAGRDDLTDDSAVAEEAGLAVVIVPASDANFKVTTPEDLARAEEQIMAQLDDIRVGSGFDVHRFAPGDLVNLCGVKVPHEHGLEGHSDADVALHALTDAILGAIAQGDIGSHFPPTDAQWRGAESAHFLRHAVDLVLAQGGVIAHLDLTIIGERPKVGPHRDAMRARVAEICGLPIGRVAVKATTTEGLGFTGRREGLAAQATATVRLPTI